MAKTAWADGSHLTPAQMILFFGNNAGTGHDHDGTDDDGHCPKIELASMVSDYLTGTINVDVTSTYFSTPINDDWTYYKIGSVVFLLIPSMLGTHATNDELQFEPNSGNWPSLMIPSSIQFIGGVHMSKQGTVAERRIGSLRIPSSTSSNVIAEINDDTAELLTTGFGTGTGEPKGIYKCTIAYIVD